MARLLHVTTPFFDQGGHVIREPGVEPDHLTALWMDESQGLRMEGLPWTQLETVLYELAVLGVDGSFSDFGAAVTGVIEQRMPDMTHMDPYLVGPSGLKPALDHCDITESLQDLVVRDGVLRPFVVLGIDLETEPVVEVIFPNNSFDDAGSVGL